MTTKKKTAPAKAKAPAKKPAAKAATPAPVVKQNVEAPVAPALKEKPKARTSNARTAPEVKTTKGGQRYVERKLIKAPAQTKG